MKNIIKNITLLGCSTLLMMSCSISGPALNTKALVTTNSGTKKGVAKEVVWFGFGSIDVSLTKAAKKGKITKIASVDYSYSVGFLGLKKTYETIVTGE